MEQKDIREIVDKATMSQEVGDNPPDLLAIDGSWRPEGWLAMRQTLANQPIEWSPSKPSASPTLLLMEATATKILEEFIAAGTK